MGLFSRKPKDRKECAIKYLKKIGLDVPFCTSKNPKHEKTLVRISRFDRKYQDLVQEMNRRGYATESWLDTLEISEDVGINDVPDNISLLVPVYDLFELVERLIMTFEFENKLTKKEIDYLHSMWDVYYEMSMAVYNIAYDCNDEDEHEEYSRESYRIIDNGIRNMEELTINYNV